MATLALAVSSLAVTLSLGGNGFIAAFFAGVAFGALADRSMLDLDRTGEQPGAGDEPRARPSPLSR